MTGVIPEGLTLVLGRAFQQVFDRSFASIVSVRGSMYASDAELFCYPFAPIRA
jgi:hypothetical protein